MNHLEDETAMESIGEIRVIHSKVHCWFLALFAYPRNIDGTKTTHGIESKPHMKPLASASTLSLMFLFLAVKDPSKYVKNASSFLALRGRCTSFQSLLWRKFHDEIALRYSRAGEHSFTTALLLLTLSNDRLKSFTCVKVNIYDCRAVCWLFMYLF